jgi:transposase InsO family protein
MRAFCAQHGVSTASLCKWRRRYEREGAAALEPRPHPRAGGYVRGPYSAEERLRAVEAYRKSGLTKKDFARTWGVNKRTLYAWLKRYEQAGPQGLAQPRQRARSKAPAAPVRDAVVAVKRRFPHFGLKRIRDYLRRFAGLKAGVPAIRRTLQDEQLETPKPKRKKRRRPAPRRFERSRPRELWQSDLTSLWLSRQQRRVYLVVFLDDFSRYVVSWALHVHQRSEMVCEALLDGIARYGRPEEVLTDQGRQYFTWRGKGRFQKLLAREGIRHVVSRSHHPQTLGKTERLWSTIGSELWERVMPEDLVEARARLSHFFAHYNFYRPHQGIDGLVPADRFFGAEDAVRRTMQTRLEANELSLALGEAPRSAVFLTGRVGDKEVSLHGEQGALVIQTPDGVRQELRVEDLGGSEHGSGTKAQDARQAHALQAGAEDAGAGEGAVGERERGAAQAGARDQRGDPAVLAGQAEQAGDGGDLGRQAAARVAAQSAGAVGYGGGAAEAASQEEVRDRDATGGRSEGAEEADRRAGAGARDRAGRDRAAARPAGEPGDEEDAALGEKKAREDEEEDSPAPSAQRSRGGSGRDGSDDVSAARSQGFWE